MTFIDLFAGIGGIRLGFEAAGGRCVYTSEWDAYARRTYAANFPDNHAIVGDITQVDCESIPDHDVLLAGFPCQPFSIAGVSKKNALGCPHGFHDKTQGTLFFHVARILAAKQPAAFFLENVKNLVTHDKGNTFRIIRETLEELGYHICWKVIDGQHFVPQHRERIFIAGFRRIVPFSWETMQLPGRGSVRLGSILHRRGDVSPIDGERYTTASGLPLSKYTLSDHLWQYLQDYAAKHKAAGNGFGCSVFGPRDVSRTLSARYYKDGSEILISQGTRKNPRRLTPRECARLMGFPDSFQIPVSDTRAYKQFGNSVVVPLVAAAACHMYPYIQEAVLEMPVVEQTWQTLLTGEPEAE